MQVLILYGEEDHVTPRKISLDKTLNRSKSAVTIVSRLLLFVLHIFHFIRLILLFQGMTSIRRYQNL